MTIEKDNLRLHHIVEATEHISAFINEVSKEEFEADYEKQSAVIRQFEIIGEAAGKLTPEFVKKHPAIDWPKVVGMRPKMIHDYFDVDINIVWITATKDAPSLKEVIEKVIDNT